ncbi:MAG: hypothetical protein R2716_02690 [Microthrixaceae bacterium]
MRTDKFRLMRVLGVLLATFALVASACTDDNGDGGDGGSDENQSSAESDSGTDNGGDSGDAGQDSGDSSDEGAQTGDFSSTVAEVSSQVEAAEDACDLYSAVAVLATVGNPETAEETRQAVDFYVLLVNKMADTSSDEATAAALRTGAEQFQAYAESVDYDPEQMDLNGMGPQFEGSSELNNAMNEYGNTEFLDCEIPGTGTVTEDGATTEGGG